MRKALLACMVVLAISKGGTPAPDTLDVDAALTKRGGQVSNTLKRKEQ